MKIQTTLALVAATLALGVPVAAAAPDGYQPQLQPSVQPDAIDRYLASNGPDGFQPQLQPSVQPDAIDRYLANNRPDGFQRQLQANAQPDAIARYLRNNPSVQTASVDRGGRDGSNWQTGTLAALGGVVLVILAAFVASSMRVRRRLVLR